MAKPKVKITGLEASVFEGINKSRELRRAFDRFVDDVQRAWLLAWEARGPHPYEAGDYVQSIKQKKLSLRQRLFIKSTLGKGIPIGVVYSDHPVAHILEYGSGPDPEGTNSPWGRDTPTPAFGAMRAAAEAMNHRTEVV